MTPTNRNRKSNTSTTANNNKNASTVTLPRRVDCFKQQQQNYLLKLISIDLSGLYYVDRMQFFTKKMRSVAWLKACVMWYRWPKNHQKYLLKCTALPMSSIHFFSPLLSYEMANEFLILKYMIVRIVLWFVCAWAICCLFLTFALLRKCKMLVYSAECDRFNKNEDVTEKDNDKKSSLWYVVHILWLCILYSTASYTFS